MLLGTFYKVIFKKNIKIILFISYIFILLILFLTFIVSAKNNAVTYVKSDMQKKLETLLLSVHSEFNKKVGYAMSLVDNNSVKMPLNLGLDTPIQEYLNKKLAGSTNKIIIINGKNQVIYNNTESFNDLSDIKFSDEAFSCYIYNKQLYKLNYIPVLYQDDAANAKNQRVGAIITAYNFLDFYNISDAGNADIPYTYYGFMGGRLKFKIKDKPVVLDNPIKTSSLHKLKDGFCYINVDGQNSLIFMKSLKLSNSTSPFILASSISPQQLIHLESRYLLNSLLIGSLAIVLITTILGFSYYMLRKDFSSRLEIQNLRTQKHDFSKHISIIRGMTTLCEYDELKSYINCLSEKLSFDGELSKIGCPPLSVLIEEKKQLSLENCIDFQVEVKTSLHELRADSADLCIVIGNLIDNAIESCLERQSSPMFVNVEIGNYGAFFSFKISSNGNPIPEKHLQRIFRPGYTTKLGKDRGMGLFIVSKALKRYHGRIQVESTFEKTVFMVFLPRKLKQ